MSNPTQSETLLREALEVMESIEDRVSHATNMYHDATRWASEAEDDGVSYRDWIFGPVKAVAVKIHTALQSIPEPLLDEGPVMRSDLVERLRRKRRVLHDADRLHSTLELINPDGPEAAKVIERLREDLAKIAVTGVKVPTRSACINIARAAIEAMPASVIDEGLLALNQIADGDYDVLAANPHRWPCMIARKALGLPLQQRYYEAHKAALTNHRDEP